MYDSMLVDILELRIYKFTSSPMMITMHTNPLWGKENAKNTCMINTVELDSQKHADQAWMRFDRLWANNSNDKTDIKLQQVPW